MGENLMNILDANSALRITRRLCAPLCLTSAFLCGLKWVYSTKIFFNHRGAGGKAQRRTEVFGGGFLKRPSTKVGYRDAQNFRDHHLQLFNFIETDISEGYPIIS